MTEYVRIAAIADIHSPRYHREFKEVLSRCKKPDLFLLAGDMVNFGKIEEYRNVSEAIIHRFGNELPIVACFGNEERGVTPYDMMEIVGERITFLDGDSLTLDHNDRKIGILGVPVMDPVKSPKDKSLEDIFEEKIRHMGYHLGKLKESCDKVILLLHYSPLSSEAFPEAFSWWISEALETVSPNLIIHGHVHDAKTKKVEIEATTILNVALPVTGSVTELSLDITHHAL